MLSIDELAKYVRGEVSHCGYARLAAISEEDFFAVTNWLEPVIARVDVRPAKGPSLLSSASAMPFHTDGPEAELVGWWCVQPARTAGRAF